MEALVIKWAILIIITGMLVYMFFPATQKMSDAELKAIFVKTFSDRGLVPDKTKTYRMYRNGNKFTVVELISKESK